MFQKIIDKTKNFLKSNQIASHLTEYKDGFLFFVDDDFLIIDIRILSKTIKYINKNQIKSIAINESYCPKLDNLDFLNEISHIENITILQKNLNIKPIENLQNLKVLSSCKSINKINLEKMTLLEELSIDFNNVCNYQNCIKLKNLSFDNYNNQDFKELEKLINLEKIYLLKPKIKNFIGLENLFYLKSIDLNYSSKLESLNGLPKQLENLYIYKAKYLTDYSNLENLKALKKLQLVTGGDLENLDFIKNLDSLEFLQLGMNVKYGDKFELMKKNNKK